jgi:ABC-type long-subunit fatty acid transport system fused permease/ATPase subunit
MFLDICRLNHEFLKIKKYYFNMFLSYKYFEKYSLLYFQINRPDKTSLLLFCTS